VLLAGRPNTPEWKPAELNRVFEEGGMYVGGEFAPVAYYRMAEAKMNLGDRAAAVEYCRSALTKAYVTGPGEALASRILRRMYTLLGADEVVKYCQEKLATEPDSVAANLAMFDVMKIKGEYNKSLSYIDKCLESVGREDPRSLSFVMNKVSVLTLAYRRTSDNSYLAKAIGEYESLLAEMPNNTVVMNNLAYLLAESGEKLPEALGYAARACELSPNNAGLMDTYAYVLHRNGKNSEADKLLQAAIQLYGQDEALVPADVYEHLGMIKEGLGSTTEALASYKLALDAGGDDLPDSMRERISSAIKRLSGSE
jgi:tetratricopeptide (TPR) repeat protein